MDHQEPKSENTTTKPDHKTQAAMPAATMNTQAQAHDNGKTAFLGADRIIVKEFPPRGNLQQFRLNKVATFTCARCAGKKTAKLVAVREGDWSLDGGGLLCNGCYGWLLANADATWE